MTAVSGSYLWDDSRHALRAVEFLAEPEVMDSWLTDGGRVRNIDRHENRFINSVADRGLSHAGTIRRFLDAVRETVPLTGSYFPRVECCSDGTLGLRLRLAPQLADSAVLWTSDVPDPRTSPRVKGPDNRALRLLREAARAHGADEAVIVDRHGAVLEGAYSALVWWRDGCLRFADPAGPVLPSVTRSLVADIARLRGVPLRSDTCRPDQLARHPVWMLSALHGIRTVTGWIGHPPSPPALASRDEWQQQLTSQYAEVRVSVRRPERYAHDI